MEYSLLLPVDYRGKALEFAFSVVPRGYTYRFAVQIEGAGVTFEGD